VFKKLSLGFLVLTLLVAVPLVASNKSLDPRSWAACPDRICGEYQGKSIGDYRGATETGTEKEKRLKDKAGVSGGKPKYSIATTPPMATNKPTVPTSAPWNNLKPCPSDGGDCGGGLHCSGNVVSGKICVPDGQEWYWYMPKNGVYHFRPACSPKTSQCSENGWAYSWVRGTL
jgi:hypothetical protein